MRIKESLAPEAKETARSSIVPALRTTMAAMALGTSCSWSWHKCCPPATTCSSHWRP